MTAVHDLRCASCGRLIGYSTTGVPTRNAFYCDRWCVEEPNVTPMEERNDEWRALVTLGYSPVQVARMYDVHHPLVYKVINKD